MVLRLLELLGSVGRLLGMGVYPSSQEVGLLFQSVVAVSYSPLLIVVRFTAKFFDDVEYSSIVFEGHDFMWLIWTEI